MNTGNTVFTRSFRYKQIYYRTVVVAQLVEQSLPTPEIRGLHPVINKFMYLQLHKINCIEKTIIKIKEAGNGAI